MDQELNSQTNEFDTATIWLRQPMSDSAIQKLVEFIRRYRARVYFTRGKILVEGTDTQTLGSILGAEGGALIVAGAVGSKASETIEAIRDFFEVYDSFGEVGIGHRINEERFGR